MSDDRKGKSRSRDSMQETLDEHRECMQIVSELESCLDQKPDDAARWVAAVMQHLPALEREMREHFQVEERGALFTELPLRRPQVADRLEALKEEHPRMLVEIEQIIGMAEGMREAELYELRELNARIQLFVARLRRHEATENELVYETYWDDIGTGD